MSNENELAQLSARIEDFVQRIELISDPAVRANVVALVQSLMDLHGQAICRLSDLLSREGAAGQRVLDNLAADDLVSGLLLLYECHPESLERRVEKAIEKIRDHLRPSGAKVQLLSVENQRARIRLTAEVSGCGSGLSAIEKTIEDVIYSAAPDVVAIDVEKGIHPRNQASELVQLQVKAARVPL